MNAKNAILLVLMAATLGLCFLSGQERKRGLQEAYSKGYKQGFKDGAASVNIKTILATNQKAANKACYVWWFTMTVKERTLRKI